MKNRVKKLWVEALWSGCYKQGRKRLRYGNTYCCLGVLCDLYRKKTGEGEWNKPLYGALEKRNPNSFCFDTCKNKTSRWLPAAVSDWSGLSDKQQSALATLNDVRSFDFNGIADYIEKEWWFNSMKIEIRENHKNAYDTTTIKILEKVLRKYAEIKKSHCVDYEILDDQETYNIVSFEEEFGLSQDVDFGFESSPSAAGP